ncbi:hypothetical protein ACFPM0_12160 [Pseudonocardia sulfidoxydans]
MRDYGVDTVPGGVSAEAHLLRHGQCAERPQMLDRMTVRAP